MPKSLTPERRRAVLFAAFGSMLAAFPLWVLLPLRQTHRLSDPPYFGLSGICIGLAIACLIAAMAALIKSKSRESVN